MALHTGVHVTGRAKLVVDVGVKRVIAEKLNVVDNGTGVAPARRIADRVSDLERKILLSCFSIDHENDTLLPPTGFTHPG